MKFGFSADDSRCIACSIKSMPEKEVYAGILLFSFGTAPTTNAVLTTGQEKTVELVERSIQATIEKLVLSKDEQDLRYAALKILDTLQINNSTIYELSAFLGQGIYLGGAITYITGTQYIIFPFGGGHAYTWNGTTFMLQGEPPSPDGIIRDAIGASKTWKGQCWTGTLPHNSYLFLTSDMVEDSAAKTMAENLCGSHANLPSMMLRKHLINTDQRSAVMHFLNAFN